VPALAIVFSVCCSPVRSYTASRRRRRLSEGRGLAGAKRDACFV